MTRERGCVIALAAARTASCAYRAAHQSITIDEAYTFNHYLDGAWSNIFAQPYFTNNHVLYSILAKFSQFAFGNAEWSLRLPSVIAGSFSRTWRVRGARGFGVANGAMGCAHCDRAASAAARFLGGGSWIWIGVDAADLGEFFRHALQIDPIWRVHRPRYLRAVVIAPAALAMLEPRSYCWASRCERYFRSRSPLDRSRSRFARRVIGAVAST